MAYRFFSTDTRSYILADTPGHERYTRNMFTGASNAHVAILLVDARAGVLRQTRRHARIAKLFGITHFVATVNKIDLVDFDQNRFAEVEDELQQVAARLGGADLTVIPIAAKHGDNVVHRSDRTPWYHGPDAAGVPRERRTVRAAAGSRASCGCRSSGFRGRPPTSAGATPAGCRRARSASATRS